MASANKGSWHELCKKNENDQNKFTGLSISETDEIYETTGKRTRKEPSELSNGNA